jgi:hypothetical protein
VHSHEFNQFSHHNMSLYFKHTIQTKQFIILYASNMLVQLITKLIIKKLLENLLLSWHILEWYRILICRFKYYSSTIIISDMHCRSDNLTTIYKLYRRYCSTSHGQNPAIASQKLQTNLLAIQNWFKRWRMKANGCKSFHVTFTT